MPEFYEYDQGIAVDPSNRSMVASNASVLVFAPGDASRTPLVLWNLSRTMQLANPVKVSEFGYGPAFSVETHKQVAWEGGGFTGLWTSFRGMEQNAKASAEASQASAQAAGDALQLAKVAADNAAAGAAGALAGAVEDAEEAKEEARKAAGLVGAPAGAAVLAAIQPGGAAHGALNGTIGAQVLPVVKAATSSAMSLPGRRWAFLGDSITDGSSATNFSYSYAPMALEIAGTLIASSSFIEAGTPGQRIAEIAARVEMTLDAGAEGLVVQAGTNDAGRSDTGAATPFSDFQAQYQIIVDAAKRRGIPVIVCTIPPRKDPSEPQITQARNAIAQYNAWLRLWAPGQGCILSENWGALADPESGNLLAAYDSGDGVHPNNAGHYRMAKQVSAAMREASRPNLGLSFVFGKSPFGLAPNPLNTGTGPRPASFYEQPGGTGAAPAYSLVDDTSGILPAGRWAQVDFNGTASGGIRDLATSLSSTGWAAGDRLAVTGYVQVEDVTGNWEANSVAGTSNVSINILNQSAVNVSSAWARNPGRKNGNVYNLGPFLKAFTVPSGTTGMLFWLRTVVPTGSHIRARFGAIDVLNLTKLGVADVEPGIIRP